MDAQGNQLNTYEHGGAIADQNQTNSFQLAERVVYGSSRLGILAKKVDMFLENPENLLSLYLGEKLYEMSNHLGNVLTVINDIKVPYLDGSDVAYYATIVSTADYSPFGVQLDGRTESAESYRYGFNGMEKDDEMKGAGNSYDFGARMYDSRLGRWLTRDPHESKYPFISTYVFVNNMPIRAIDPDGRDIIILNAPSGARRLGHGAVLIGNDKDGWHYYSKNGTQDHGMRGESHEPNLGQGKDYFSSIAEFANSKNNFVNGEQFYTSALRITTSDEKDQLMKEAAFQQCKQDYDLGSASCQDVCSDALEAAGLNPVDMSINHPTPNSRFEEITKQNKGNLISNSLTPTRIIQHLEREANKTKYSIIIAKDDKPIPNEVYRAKVAGLILVKIDNTETKKAATKKLEILREALRS